MGKMNPDWYKGYLVELDLKRNEKGKIEEKFNIIPYIQSFESEGIYVLEGKLKKKFINDIFSEIDNLSSDTYIEKKWNDFCDKNKDWYLRELIGDKDLSKTAIKNNNIEKDRILKLRNLMFNESHNEMIKSSIELYVNGDKTIKK